jgi:hypothetical protein
MLRNLPNIGVSKILAVMEELKGTAVVPIGSS